MLSLRHDCPRNDSRLSKREILRFVGSVERQDCASHTRVDQLDRPDNSCRVVLASILGASSVLAQ